MVDICTVTSLQNVHMSEYMYNETCLKRERVSIHTATNIQNADIYSFFIVTILQYISTMYN